MTNLPAWAQRVNELAAGIEHRWCTWCGIPESHPVHDVLRLRSGVQLVDVGAEAERLGVAQLPRHLFVNGVEGPSDGRSPTPGDMRCPGWETWEILGGFGDLPRLEGYRQQRLAADGFAFVWREPRSCRWRWGRCAQSELTLATGSAQWLHDALARVREDYPEVFRPASGS